MRIIFSKKAQKQISKLNFFVRNKIIKVLDKFEKGERVDVKKMKGKNDEFRIRVGDYRILLDKEKEGFSVIEVGKRENIYFFGF
jgi:mRNA interferase RelE/StbE